jgi:peroxiredoxin
MKLNILFLFLLFFNPIFSQENLKTGSRAKKIYISDWLANTPNDKVLEGKYIVLLFWEPKNTTQYIGDEKVNYIENFNKLQEKFQREDLLFISVSNDNLTETKKYLKNNEFKTIAVVDKTKRTQTGFGKKDGNIVTPLVVLIDNKGIIKWVTFPYSLNEKYLKQFLNNTIEPFNSFDPKRYEKK